MSEGYAGLSSREEYLNFIRESQVDFPEEGKKDADSLVESRGSVVSDDKGSGVGAGFESSQVEKKKPGRPKGSRVKKVIVSQEVSLESEEEDDDVQELQQINFKYPMKKYSCLKMILSSRKVSLTSYLSECMDNYIREHFVEWKQSLNSVEELLK